MYIYILAHILEKDVGRSIYTTIHVMSNDFNDAKKDEMFSYVLYIGLAIIACCMCCLCFMVCRSMYKNSIGKEVDSNSTIRIQSLSAQKQLQKHNHKLRPKLSDVIKTSVSLKKGNDNLKMKLASDHHNSNTEMVNVNVNVHSQSDLPHQLVYSMSNTDYILNKKKKEGDMPVTEMKISNENEFMNINGNGNVLAQKRSVSEYSHYAAQEINYIHYYK